MNFDQAMASLRGMGEELVPYNFPLGPQSLEQDIAIFKKVELDVDGYSVLLYYNRAKYPTYYLENLQINSVRGTFLPFSLVVKIAQKFLGSGMLSLVEFFQDDRKVYCWSVCLNEEGKPIPSPIEQDSEPCEFEGFEYRYMHIEQLNFYY